MDVAEFGSIPRYKQSGIPVWISWFYEMPIVLRAQGMYNTQMTGPFIPRR
jgi:hypothetical protein